MIEYCKNLFSKNESIHLYEQDFMSLDFGEATFDHVITQFSLHHLAGDTRKQLLENVHKWLKPGGVFSYSGGFHAISDELTERHYAQWKKASYELGATDEQWSDFMDHGQRYDVLDIPIMTIADWLREIGFVEVDITWRRLLWANLIARKA
jgi:SAM-dependent methyltransferase